MKVIQSETTQAVFSIALALLAAPLMIALVVVS